ncbi:MAG: hypothetical protein MPN21_19205 [Thermoanaerobaculia bacterium]|nr:hypothetical protein [Thermoanaerobaculia bacterium]
MIKKKLVAVCLMLFVVLAWSAQAEDMTLEQVLEQHANARGGEEAFDAVESAKVTAKMTMGPGMEAPMTLYVKEPNKMRMDIEIQGAVITQAWDGEKGWQIMPLMGVTEAQEMSEDEAKQIKRQDLIRGLLLTYGEHGYEAEYLGVEEIEGTPAHKIKVTMEDGDSAVSYLDTEYFMEFMQEIDGVNPQTGQRVKTKVSYGDFKEVSGLMMPHSMEMMPEGAPSGMSMTIETIEVNTGDVSDDLFDMPEASADAGSEGDASGQG